MDGNKSILEEAKAIIEGPRRTSYGDARKSFVNVAVIWSAVLGVPVEPHQVALCMMGLKLCRESASHSRDNLVDLCGYAALAELVVSAETKEGTRE